jgi:hypothetical protein
MRLVDRCGRPWIDNEANEIAVLELYDAGFGMAKISNMVGSSTSRVESFLKAKGVFREGKIGNARSQALSEARKKVKSLKPDRFAGSLL